ncbi:YfjL-like protein [Cellulosilyticum sp. I15G10I2]|uniref:YfjL-like protein n=1 Tax=Cellulosilyticum sp. I15G10I2 TaxID=1892843 RepID=UPI00085C9599|nr:hypothetical protein [Cellulosilyticum sp. I15G10I2]
MKNTKKIILKILSGTTAAVLIGGMFFVTNAFVGNPISAMIANKEIKQYVNQNYAFLDLKIEKASYNFKSGGYMARAFSETSIDTQFSIYYRKGRVERDDYENHVLERYNTLQRLEHEYSAVAKTIMEKELGYKNNTTVVMFDKDAYGSASTQLELDMKFDKKILLNAEVIIGLNLADNSLQGVAKIITESHKVFLENGCHFSKYGLYAESDGALIMVNGVTPSDIESGELISLLEKAKNNEGIKDISVFIKGQNK